MEHPPAKRLKPDYSDAITVLVGPKEKGFAAHKTALCARSPFFKVACSRDWKEGQEKVVRLPEHESGCFHIYLHHVYTGTLDMTLMEEPPSLPHSNTFASSYLNLSKVWILGNYLGDDFFCNGVTDRALEKLDARPSESIALNTLRHVWDNTLLGSKLRKLFTDATIARMSGAYFNGSGDELPPDVLKEMARRFVFGEQRLGSGPTFKERCLYHLHGTKESKCG